MFKNVGSQKVIVFAFDATTNTPKTGDAANLSAYISKDFGAITQLTDTSATEMDATNAKGYYLFDITQTETNADVIAVTGKSSTANIVVIGAPATIFTVPANFTATSIDSSGRLDIAKIAGTSQTARDIGASVLLSAGSGTGQLDVTSGVVKSNLSQILGTALTETAGQLAGGFKKFFNIGSPASTMDALTLVATATNLTNAPTAGDFTATMKTSIGTAVAASAVASVTGNVGGNVTGSVGSLATQAKADVNAEVVDALTVDVIADAIPADGSRPTIAQALYMLTQFMVERAVSSTTVTVKKPDGSTTLFTLTLDDATSPTSITRAS
jgi:hypothetical protein